MDAIAIAWTQAGPIALILICAAVTWLDIRYRRIPNWLSALTLACGLANAMWLYGMGGAGSHLLHFAFAFVLGMILFGLGVFGGGDAKFYAATAAWFPITKFASLIFFVTVAGIALLLVWFTYRRHAGYPIHAKPRTKYDGLPYGIAIGAGALATMVM